MICTAERASERRVENQWKISIGMEKSRNVRRRVGEQFFSS